MPKIRLFILFFLVPFLTADIASAGDSNWAGPGSDFNTAGNWSAGIPMDVATFNTAMPLSLSLSAPISLNAIVFNQGAAAYTIRTPLGLTNSITINGQGILNNSSNTQSLVIRSSITFNNSATVAHTAISLDDGFVLFNSSSTAGTANFSNVSGDIANIIFANNSSAGNSIIINSGSAADTYFWDNSTADHSFIINNGGYTSISSHAGNAMIINEGGGTTDLAGTADQAEFTNNVGGLTRILGGNASDQATFINNAGGATEFQWQSTGGNDTIIDNSGGQTVFMDTSTAGNATIINNSGGSVYVSSLTAPGLTAGSISGAGSYYLGYKSLTVGSNNMDTEVSGVISGLGGSLVKVGTGTLTLSGFNTYNGGTTVNAGTLSVTGSLAATTQVQSGGTLSGTGTVGAVLNNGVVYPGVKGVGTLVVDSYSGSGALNVSCSNTAANNLQVTNNANLSDGTLNLMGRTFTVGAYRVLSAGSITGSFSMLGGLDIVKYSVIYEPTDIMVEITQVGFMSAAQTSNQMHVASALDAASVSGNTNFSAMTNSLALLSPAQGQAAYDQISGDALASFQSTAFRNTAAFTHQMIDHGSSNESMTTAGLPVPLMLAYNGDVQNLSGLHSAQGSPHGFWTRGIGLFDHVDSDSSIGSPGSQANTGGFQIGYDYAVADQWLLGVSAGYATTSLSVDDRSSSGKSTTYEGGVYTRYAPGPWYFDGSLAYSGSSNDNTRTIMFPGVSEQANARFNSGVVTEFAEAGYAFKPGNDFLLEPSVGLRASQLHQAGYSETGAPGLDLSVDDQNPNSTVSLFGTRLSRVFFQNTSHPFSLGFHAVWEHELGAAENEVTAQFVDAPGASFTVQGTPRPRNAADLGADARINLTKNLQSFANYFANLGDGENVQGIMGGLSLKW